MSEGDTIFRTAVRLGEALEGERVTESRLFREARTLVEPGTVVRAVRSRGKHLLIFFEGDRILHTHLGMTGAWRTYRAGEDWRWSRARARVLIGTEEVLAVCFAAPVVEVFAERALRIHPSLSALGPDLCSPIVDLDAVVTRFSRLAPPEEEIGPLLLDQRIACGIGNVYKSEILFAERLDPFAPAGRISPSRIRDVYATASTLLRRNLRPGRRRTVAQGLAVYGRAPRPCLRCAQPIRARRQGDPGRVTYWCLSCQPPIF
jgi:endonuclease-8